MTAVAVCYETPTKFSRLTCADGIGVAKGTLMKLVTENYGTAMSAGNDPAGGIAWMEKVASDGSTELTVARDGVWGITASTHSGITVGNQVVADSANMITKFDTLDDENGYVYGKSLETYATTASAVIKVRLNC